MTEFTERVIEVISAIPAGRVMTYGSVAISAGSPGGARQVVRILHTQTEKFQLPWQRVISTGGYLKIRDPELHHLHKMLLLNEGIEFISENQLDLEKYGWQPEL